MAERPDFERVLAKHVLHSNGWAGTTPGWSADCLGCDWTARGQFGGMASAMHAHRAHLAATLNAVQSRWLADEGTRERVAEALRTRMAARDRHPWVVNAEVALAALAPTEPTAEEGALCSDCGRSGQCAACHLMAASGVPTPPRLHDRTPEPTATRGEDGAEDR